MGAEIQGLLGLIVLILDVWAIVKTIQSGASVGGKVAWIVAILIFPILGFLVWLFAGPRGDARPIA